jgi:hypothetical protein
LSMHAEDQYEVRALAAGASAYLTKGSRAEVLQQALRRLASGGRFIGDRVAEVNGESVSAVAPGQARLRQPCRAGALCHRLGHRGAEPAAGPNAGSGRVGAADAGDDRAGGVYLHHDRVARHPGDPEHHSDAVLRHHTVCRSGARPTSGLRSRSRTVAPTTRAVRVLREVIQDVHRPLSGGLQVHRDLMLHLLDGVLELDQHVAQGAASARGACVLQFSTEVAQCERTDGTR